MNTHIVGNPKPILGKNIYVLNRQNIKEQHWKLLKNGRTILDLGTDGCVTFNQKSLGQNYVIQVEYVDEKGIKGYDRLNITPIAGKPEIQQVVWKDEYYNNINGTVIGYADNIRLHIFTLNIPAGETLNIIIWEDEGTDGHADSSRNMGTYTAKVDKYGKAEVYFNNIKVFMNNLNKKDIFNESEHEFYAQIQYKKIVDKIEDTIQLKVKNTLEKLIPPPKHNKVAVVDIPDKKKKPENKKGIKVTVNVFFDGTKNNAKNTEARLINIKEQRGIKITDTEKKASQAYKSNHGSDTSYENFYSNIAILQQTNTVDNTKRECKIYIEGEGTENLQSDSTKGYAYGSGSTGIPAKVDKAFRLIKDEIETLKKNKFIKREEFVNEIELNIFGFSRGSAAARHFISRRGKLSDMYNLASDKLYVKFVGLYDTVSSYSENISASPNFTNDVDELKLKVEGNVQKIVHLTAADEYRENFSLTTIKSSIDAGVGFELELPGVHSDIGGGYGEIENEDRNLTAETNYNNIRAELISQGWYNKEQLFQIDKNKDNTDHFEFELHGIRKKIPNSYQYIPLEIMLQLAERYGLKFDKTLIDSGQEEFYKIPDDLKEAKEILTEYALNNDGAHNKRVSIYSKHLHPIRNKYLHRSTSDNLGMNGRCINGKPNRLHIKG